MDEQTNIQAQQCSNPIGCGDKTGCLPACAPLANPYVPFQRENSEKYSAAKALIRGTLYPGLDLPFMGLINRNEKNTPLGQLQALGFALHELGLYLDTHQNDTEALELFDQYNCLYTEAVSAYVAQYGPQQQFNASVDGKYLWLKDPWPWDYMESGGEK